MHGGKPISIWSGGFVLIVCLGAGAAGAAGGDPWEGPGFSAPPAAVAEAAKRLPPPEEADVEFLLSDTTLRFDAQGRVERTARRVYRCLTRKGVESWAAVESSWAPWHEDRPSIRARVVTPDGAAHALDPASIGEVPADQDEDVLTDRRKLRAPLPALDEGAVVEWEQTVREREPRFAQGDVYGLGLGMLVAVRRLRITIDAPTSLPLKHAVRGIDIKPARTEKDGRVKLVFEVTPTKPLEWPEPFMPRDIPRWPEVVVSTGRSWDEVAAGYAAIVERQMDIEAVRPMVRSEVAAEQDRRGKAAKLLAAVRRLVRYTGVEFGEASIVPRKPGETLARRYGDCKDQATLLVAMLRAADVRAHVALVHTDAWRDVMGELPGLGAFDHAIVYVPGDPPLWIDPTATYVPCGRVPLNEQGRLALVVAPGARELGRIPVGRHEDNTITSRIEYDLRQGPGAQVSEQLVATGSCAWQMRAMYGSGGKEERKKAWQEYAKSAYASDALDRFDFSPLGELDKPFTVDARISRAVVPEKIVGNHERIVLLRPVELLERLPHVLKMAAAEDGGPAGANGPAKPGSPPARRTKPLALPEPHVAELGYRLVLPPGFAVEKLPPDGAERFGPATLSRRFEAGDEGIVRGTFRLDTGPGLFTAEEVEALRKGLAALGPDGNLAQWEVEVPMVHLAARHLAAGRIKEAIDEHRCTIQRFPKCLEERARYARTLNAAGLADAARQEARRAVELDPKSAHAQAELGRILVCDLAGRRFGRTMDWEGAAAAYRRALELDPKDLTARLDYAILLEHNPRGQRYDPRHLDAAAEQYRLAIKDLQSPQQWQTNLAFVLLYSGKFAELAKMEVNADSTDGLKQLHVAAIAARDGPAKAVSEATSLEADAEKRRMSLRTAVHHLGNAREYAKAVALAEALDEGDRKLTPAILAERYRNLRRWEHVDPPDEEPQRLVRHVVGHLASGCDFADVRPWFIDGTTEEDVRASQHLRWNEQDEAAPDAGSLPPWRRADAIMSAQLKVDGDKDVGYGVGESTPQRVECRYHVLPTGKGLRMVAPGRELANLGRVALQLLAEGKVEPARKWLLWAYEGHRRDVGWFDAFAGVPFARMWWTAQPKDAEGLKIAAAALACEGAHAEAAIAVLCEARGKPGLADAQALQLDRALAQACLEHRQWARALEAAERILKAHPKSFVTRTQKIEALEGLGRTGDALQVVREDLESSSIADQQRASRAVDAARCGDFDLAQKHNRELRKKIRWTAGLDNEMAWNAVCQGRVDEEALRLAQEADEDSGGMVSAFLHTQAAVYAELGKPAEALKSLRRSIDVRGGQIRPVDWYVLGRVAEGYKLNDAAAACYAKVTDEEPTHANSTFRVAQRRLKALGEKP